MRLFLRLAGAIDATSRWIGTLAYWLIPAMMLIGAWNVFGRLLPRVLADSFGLELDFNLTSNALIEAQWYLFSLIFLLGAPYVLLQNGHVRVDMLYCRLRARQRAWVNLVGAVLLLVPLCLLIIVTSLGFVANSWSILEQSPDPSGLPRYPIKTLIPIGATLLLLQGLSEAIKNLAFLRSEPGEPGEPGAAGLPDPATPATQAGPSAPPPQAAAPDDDGQQQTQASRVILSNGPKIPGADEPFNIDKWRGGCNEPIV